MRERDAHTFIALTREPIFRNSDLRQALGNRVKETDVLASLQTMGADRELDPLLESVDRFTPYQQAVAASQLSSNHFNESKPVAIKAVPDIAYNVSIIDPVWSLCETSEQRLMRAVEEGAVTVVEPGLAVKFVGRLTAFCFESFSTKTGTFVKNNWYSPVSTNLRSSLAINFDQGVRRIHAISGTWELMRQFNGELNPSVTARIAQIPEQTMRQADPSWKSYREKQRELFC